MALAVVLGGFASACAGGREAGVATPPPVTMGGAAPYTQADVAFMQGMIHHHGQALDMTALAEARAADANVRLLAERIEATQENEILRMGRWLAERAETVPAPVPYRNRAADGAHVDHGAHDAHGGLMPGMLTPAEMDRLASATGAQFDRLFLEYMIRHHEGALTMVAELQSAGGGVEAEIYRFAADVDADQRAEIARMRSMLTVLQRGSE